MEKKLKTHLNNGIFENVDPKRSTTMSSIKGKNNKSTELKLRMALIRNRISGWQLTHKELPGKPDFYFKKERIAIFVDGCFWHGCPICGHIPKTRTEFWEAKINRNKERDRLINRKLNKLDIKTLRFWEHELKKLDTVISRINNIIQQRS